MITGSGSVLDTRARWEGMISHSDGEPTKRSGQEQDDGDRLREGATQSDFVNRCYGILRFESPTPSPRPKERSGRILTKTPPSHHRSSPAGWH
jgi:hypothetical protein